MASGTHVFVDRQGTVRRCLETTGGTFRSFAEDQGAAAEARDKLIAELNDFGIRVGPDVPDTLVLELNKMCRKFLNTASGQGNPLTDTGHATFAESHARRARAKTGGVSPAAMARLDADTDRFIEAKNALRRRRDER